MLCITSATKSQYKSEFKIYSPITKSNNELDEDGTLTLEGVASTTSIDLDNDMVSKKAIESMKKFALELNIHANHDRGLFDGVIGNITEVLESDDTTLKIKFKILADYAARIKSMLDIGIKLGLSIGGAPTGWKETETPDGKFVWIIEDIILFEISLTPMPANWDTFNTVTTSKGLVKSRCLAGACYQIIKNTKKRMNDTPLKDTTEDTVIENRKTYDDGENMTKKNINKQDEDTGSDSEVTEAKVTDMINEALTLFENEQLPTIKEDIKAELKEEIKSELLDELKEDESSDEGTESGTDVESEKKVEPEKEVSTEELEKQIAENVEKRILEKLAKERVPEPSDPPEEDNGDDVDETKKTHKGIPRMSREDIAKNLAESRSQSGLAAIIQNIQE